MVTERIQTYDEWVKIRNLFTRNGFSEEEAEWAANNNLDISDPTRTDQITRLLRNRKDKVKFVMKYAKIPWDEAVDTCAETSRRNNEDRGEADTLNLFAGESP